MLEPAQRLELGDLLEALISLSRLDEAEEILGFWQPRAEGVDRAWALAILARCRGLLLAAHGDADDALASFECALAEHARDIDPFQRARTLLALGRTQRRAKKRGAARTTLEEALVEFERVGAPLWAEQARAELARISGRAPSSGELTEGERRIADLVAEGHTNREVAASLFLTEHSVETALTRVYRKLGVRSRAELARLLAQRPEVPSFRPRSHSASLMAKQRKEHHEEADRRNSAARWSCRPPHRRDGARDACCRRQEHGVRYRCIDELHAKTLTPHWQARIDTKGATDVHVIENVIAPGGSFGWHSHPGPSIVVVKSGTLTLYRGDDPTCTPTTVPGGSGSSTTAATSISSGTKARGHGRLRHVDRPARRDAADRRAERRGTVPSRNCPSRSSGAGG